MLSRTDRCAVVVQCAFHSLPPLTSCVCVCVSARVLPCCLSGSQFGHDWSGVCWNRQGQWFSQRRVSTEQTPCNMEARCAVLTAVLTTHTHCCAMSLCSFWPCRRVSVCS